MKPYSLKVFLHSCFLSVLSSSLSAQEIAGLENTGLPKGTGSFYASSAEQQKKFKPLFNGKDFDGWDLYLKGKALNDDADKNFQVQKEEVYVRGKELGYLRTKKSYNNFHFAVEFKWGEKKWPPREAAKRDAGICYNMPDNVVDSIWPSSIECQIQEGDCGDFWLIGYTAITINDSTNKPARNTRIIKTKDAEKGYGEWNTVEVISYNGNCVHLVNGVVVNAGKNASTTKGRLLLQSEYAEIYYRNARIKDL